MRAQLIVKATPDNLPAIMADRQIVASDYHHVSTSCHGEAIVTLNSESVTWGMLSEWFASDRAAGAPYPPGSLLFFRVFND